MPKTYSRAAAPRERRTPPHVSLGSLRTATGKTLDQVCEAASEWLAEQYPDDIPRPLTRGALSAIENGIRGASPTTLAALEAAYGLAPESIAINYVPRKRERESA